jgi:tetratricopeptide (TPR) repeat protein
MFHFRPLLIGTSSVAAILLIAAPQVQGANFEGAAQLVEKLKSTTPAPAVVPPSSDDYVHLNKDISAFSKVSASLAPEEAARQYLALFDRNIRLLSNPSQAAFSSMGIQGIVNALTGPDTWPAMQKLVEAAAPVQASDAWSHNLLLLVIHTLNNKEDKQWADLAALNSPQATAASPQVNPGDESADILVLGSKLSTVSKSADAVESFWKGLLSKMEQSPASATAPGPDEETLELPDLVTTLGAAKAEPIILRLLLLPATKFAKIDGKETQDLARKLALANIDKLQQAPWVLTDSLDGSDLYEALAKKFPADPNDQSGAIYHMLALAVQGKSDDAVKAAASLNGVDLESAVNQAAQAGYGEQIYNFLHALLQAQPESDSWSVYVNIAAQMSHAPEALQFVQDSLARKDLSDIARTKIQAVLYRALLAVDKVDEGVAQLRALIKKAKTLPASSYTPQANAWRFAGLTGTTEAHDTGQLVEWDIALARVGHVLKRDDLEKEGLDDAEQHPPTEELISYLMQTGRNSEAEKFLIDTIVTEAANEKANQRQSYDFGAYSPNQQNLVKLAQVYYNAGRWDDILTLLQQVPGWGAADLVDVAGEKAYTERYTPQSLGLMAARALVETGRVNQALPILDYALQVDAGDDAAYELLLKIGKGDLVAKLDALYQQDQFQNRPLIWKATLLLQQGKIAEAEQACKTAITVDPSDGETGKGNRMRVYSVMADVCDAKKDTTQANFFRNVVKAIRLSENADDFYDAGLLTRAVTMYGQALDLFSDAYCIQSRIARQLAELGRMDEAAVHYRKAFELMPVSFGRMESHCFGCERAFQGKTAVAIAEQTFTRHARQGPQKAAALLPAWISLHGTGGISESGDQLPKGGGTRSRLHQRMETDSWTLAIITS